jgi:hypothetical protein
MDIKPIEIDNDVFSCIQKGEFVLLTLKENALKIVTSVGVKEDLFSALSAVEESKIIKGLIFFCLNLLCLLQTPSN